jgi:anti-sigma regulatory factor (Ser/Thr protein kinase)
MAARYLPAAVESAVGGDWYDVIELGHRRLGLSIGDVAGHGLRAATYMGELRSAIRAYAFEFERPSDVLGKVSEFAHREQSRMATVIFATLNLTTFDIDFARAGHPYPLLLRSDGTTTFLSEASGPPLGAGGNSYDEQRVQLGAGDMLLLYTDGLIERRGARLADGEAALVEAATTGPTEPELLCPAILRQLTDDLQAPDDIAVLAIKAIGLGDSLEFEIPAVAEQLATARHLIRRWAMANEGTDDDCSAFAIAASEACANSIEHAYGPGDAAIAIRATLAGGVATVSVHDRGQWREPRGENRGRGIHVMKEFMDDVSIDTGESGTTVELSRRLGARD